MLHAPPEVATAAVTLQRDKLQVVDTKLPAESQQLLRDGAGLSMRLAPEPCFAPGLTVY